MRTLNPLFCVVCLVVLVACGGEATAPDSATPVPPPVVDDTLTGEDCKLEADDPDTFAIASCSPSANARDRALATRIQITFTQPLIASTLTADSIRLTAGDATVETHLDYQEGSATVVLTPKELLQPSTNYTVTVAEGLMAADGSQYAGNAWHFGTATNVGPTPQSVMDTCMSELDRDMLGRINDARAQARNCGVDTAPAAAPLAWNCTLATAAEQHSADMANNNFFSHTGSDGSSVGTRLTDAGYGWRTAGENIAAGQSSVTEVMNAWLGSSGHCANIMNSNFLEVGAALVENAQADYRRYWTQNFAHPR